MDVAIIKNTLREGPGLFESELTVHGLSYGIFDLDGGDPLPEIGSFRGLVVMGGPDSANDKTPKILGELQFIREVLSLGIPYVGVCLGLQLMVKALGGEVRQSPYKEVGFRGPDGDFFRVRLTEVGRMFPLLQGFPLEFPVLELHGEMVAFEQGFTLLGTGRWCVPQIVGYGEHAIGFQGHVEVDPPMFEYLIQEDEDLCRLNTEKLREDYRTVQKEYIEVGRLLVANYAQLVKKKEK
ncbi:MAG: type 1 glutamine amidotransferase [Treponemataceae bacterium]|nr:type 1 glutamine amidotransferase [Treponemataceae bacterium]